MKEHDPGDPLEPEELAALPIFPLPRVVFFPGSAMPLHVFEPRYREMLEDCVSRGPRAIAMALFAPGWEDDYQGRPAIRSIAGAGRIADWQRRPDGRFDLVLYGVARVRLEELPPEGKLYRRARATVLPDRIPHLEPIDRMLPDVLSAASSIAAILRRRHPEFELGVDGTSEPGLIADRLTDRLVADVDRRQAILEQTDVKVRLALVHETLLELFAALGPAGALH